MGSVSAQVGPFEQVFLSDATLGIWITIHALHVGVIILGVVLLVQNIRVNKPLNRKILPLVIIPLIIVSCIRKFRSKTKINDRYIRELTNYSFSPNLHSYLVLVRSSLHCHYRSLVEPSLDRSYRILRSC
jgi:uncharacterized membrane protein